MLEKESNVVEILDLARDAHNGDALAQFKMGMLYIDHHDYVQGAHWIMHAAGHGLLASHEAQYLEYLEKAAAHGIEDARSEVVYSLKRKGHAHYEGNNETKDYAKALVYFKKAAAYGDSEAQFYVGLMHENGEGTRQNFSKARRYYEMAAKQGNPEAQVNLGFMCAEGRGGIKNNLRTKELLVKAAAGGECEAEADIGRLFLDGKPMKANPYKAKAHFKRAAMQGGRFAVEALEGDFPGGQVTWAEKTSAGKRTEGSNAGKVQEALESLAQEFKSILRG